MALWLTVCSSLWHRLGQGIDEARKVWMLHFFHDLRERLHTLAMISHRKERQLGETQESQERIHRDN